MAHIVNIRSPVVHAQFAVGWLGSVLHNPAWNWTGGDTGAPPHVVSALWDVNGATDQGANCAVQGRHRIAHGIAIPPIPNI